jgi:murein DD-endopeptidase MepM/ murein hydrolase activator NlpD
VNRLWSRVGVRVTSVGLLVLGVVGGVYLGQGREVQQQTAEAQLVVQADADEMQLLKERQNQHAAARAWQRKAEGDAAAKAAAEAKSVAGKARTLEKKAIEKKAAAKKAAAAKKKAESSGGGTVQFTGPIPESCDEYSGNRATGCALMLQAGFEIDQFPCLDKLWKKESGWNHKAANPSSGAYGIPQALPGGKMSSAGSDWRTNPATQIKWGLGYIKGRYGTPCKAWSHSQNVGWY